MTTVNVRYFAAAKAAAGVAEERVEHHGALTAGDLVGLLAARHGHPMVEVLMCSSFLLNELTVHETNTAIPDGAAFDVLPPFAGG